MSNRDINSVLNAVQVVARLETARKNNICVLCGEEHVGAKIAVRLDDGNGDVTPTVVRLYGCLQCTYALLLAQRLESAAVLAPGEAPRKRGRRAKNQQSS